MNKSLFKLFRFLRPVFHIFLILLVFAITYKLRILAKFLPFEIPIINIQELQWFAGISAWIFVLRGFIKRLYDLHTIGENYSKKLTKTRLYRFITITFCSYFGQGIVFMRWVSRFVILIGAILSYLGLFFFDQIWGFLEFHFLKKTGKKILLIYHEKLKDKTNLTKLKENFPFEIETIEQHEIEKITFEKYFFVVAVGNFHQNDLQALFEKIRFHEMSFYHLSEGYFLENIVYKPVQLNNLIFMEYKSSHLDGRSLLVKRIFDLIGATLGIILLSPLFLIIAIMIKRDSKGPVIYKSKRVGKNGKLFTFYKFRSMYTDMCVGYGWKNADKMYENLINSQANNRKGILPKIENDPRVTKIWAFLRKTSLDELPQLFQVLRGTMSLVGPRPHLEDEVAKYEPWMKRVLSIKPWITGYAQIFGRDKLPFEDEARLDLYYIKKWSLALDIYVIFATIGVVFKGR